jgi:23S rRNA (adenine2503-C2)-methyltransferase
MLNALDLSLEEWKEWCSQKELPAYAAGQIYQWIFQKGVLDPSAFTNLAQPIRQKLKDFFNWSLPAIDSHLTSSDGSHKLLLKTYDNLLIEMVVMPYENRTTLCLSCQVGCKMGCTFCQTGKLGLKRNLSSGEIVAQLLIANQFEKVTNVVFMGMGEPLDNYDEVVKACSIMIDEKAFALSKTRVTISTSGLIPEIEKLGQELPVRLAISLHSADEEQRSKMMPVNRKYPLAELKKALLNYPAPKRYGITFEYVMIKGVNDSLQHAKKLVHFLHGLKAKVNLIPVNHFPGIEMHPSDAEPIRQFQSYLTERSIAAPVRYSRGQDISGGCGQLAAKRESELHLDPRELRRQRR